jgi:hypothetical protein
MSKQWKAVIGIIVVVGILMAQQPVQLQTVNGGGAVALGHGTAATALRVELPTDGTGVVGIQGTPGMNLLQWNSVGLGSPSNYGTSPGAVNVPGVNAFITNTPAVTFAPSTSSTVALSAYHGVTSTSTYNTVKGSAGNLYGFTVFNPNVTPCYAVFYNSTAPTIGTTGIVYAFGIQAGTSVVIPPGAFALANFTTGITFATTTTDGGASVCTTGLTANASYE